MAMKRCPDCGERYSDTYENCPFCEEEALANEEGGRKLGRRSGERVNLVTPMLVILILVMAGLLFYLLKGEGLLGGSTKEPVQRPQTGTVTPVKPEQTPTEEGEGTEEPEGTETPEGPVQPEAKPETTPQTKPETTPESTTKPGTMPNAPTTPAKPAAPANNSAYDKAAQLPDGLSLNREDFTLRSIGESYTLKVSGGSGSYTWVSQDAGVASVDSTGKVVAVSRGTVNIIVSDGTKKASCIVRVSASAGGSASTGTTSTTASGTSQTPSAPTDSGSGTLNREDMTLKVGEKFQLKLSGGSGATWSTGDASVAAVSGDGTVTGIGSGSTKVTASWSGGSVSCIVRVKP